MARAGRTPSLKNPSSVNLSGEIEEIEDAKIYASHNGGSLSAIFFRWIKPLVKADKATHPDRYNIDQAGAVFYALNAAKPSDEGDEQLATGGSGQ